MENNNFQHSINQLCDFLRGELKADNDKQHPLVPL